MHTKSLFRLNIGYSFNIREKSKMHARKPHLKCFSQKISNVSTRPAFNQSLLHSFSLFDVRYSSLYISDVALFCFFFFTKLFNLIWKIHWFFYLEAQFYIQLVFKATLSFKVRTKTWAVANFEPKKNQKKIKKKIIKEFLCNFLVWTLQYFF